MGILQDIRLGREAQDQVRELTRERSQTALHQSRLDASLNHFQERIAELELSLEDNGWTQLGAQGNRDFSPQSRRKIADQSRVMFLKNPLIRRGVNVRSFYTWGQGVSMVGRYGPVNDVVQGFLDHPSNRQALTSHQAELERDADLQVEGELFFVFFTNPSTGMVLTRTIRPSEVTDIITNPEDDLDPWFYLRRWTSADVDVKTGKIGLEAEHEAYYPAMWFRPESMPKTINGIPVMDEPVYHMTATTIGGMKRGVPDTYAAMDWARAYNQFLQAWASIVQSLNRWAWTYQAGENTSVADVANALGSTVGVDTRETNPAPTTGSVMVTPSDGQLTPIPKTGAVIAADDARALRAMVATAFDLPETILSGDADVGNLATAKTLDRPTELAMANRQLKWADVLSDIMDYVIEQSIVAPSGPLTGAVEYPAGRPVFVLELDPDTQEPADATVDITFPPILEEDVSHRVSAIVSATTLNGQTPAGTIPAEDVSRMLLQALGQDDVDETLAELFPTAEGSEVMASIRADLREVMATLKASDV